MISTLPQICHLTRTYTTYLRNQGIPTDKNGFPILPRKLFLTSRPEYIVPYSHRNMTANPQTTLLCFYCPDNLIYPRMEHVFNEIKYYRQFMGVIGADITVTQDMDLTWQVEIMLLNQLFTAILGINGIPIVQNLRCGSSKTIRYIANSVPREIMSASSTLGCKPTPSMLDLSYPQKVLALRPSEILLYGKEDSIMEKQLDTIGIKYQRYDDVHTATKKGSFH
ncbi:DUF4417 domain-containing protein [Bifidobacterium vansinderenii]|uniref:Uncharacterized protein n=1 Tax=Bifidobacterium vansinderenii TaxID=1984871 RepID=A0A229VZ13_9BIFI|nr:DUF4417 domain-containing protein [Bifidobacterium vansinderenii]OXN00847.1 hypothetical protein Tam10B_0803 [Bifidobacterium vansinderenii]